MKNIIVAGITALVIGLMVFTAMDDAVYQGGEHARVIKDFGDMTETVTVSSQPAEKTDRQKEDDELKALRDKAGSNKPFKTSVEFKKKCSSCHGSTGSGYQNGRKMMGPPIYGQSEDELYRKLADFKAGRTQNIVMKGLLIKNNDEDLHRLAKEISEFKSRAAAIK